ncbi:MAG TPA: hypothetical protein DEP38_13800 [Cyanobacteria bacterium UBA9226]|nr:hypothetical protein [Cyanobacteria bacterium UBA9226]
MKYLVIIVKFTKKSILGEWERGCLTESGIKVISCGASKLDSKFIERGVGCGFFGVGIYQLNA